MAGNHSPELAELVNSIIWAHNVVIRVHSDGEELPYCFSCGYFGDKEEPALHAASLVIEYLEEYYKERFNNESATQQASQALGRETLRVQACGLEACPEVSKEG